MFCKIPNPPGRPPTNIPAASILPPLRILTTGAQSSGTQFNYRLKKDGQPYANVPDPLDHAAFAQMLDQVEENLVRMGRAIFAGDIATQPLPKRNPAGLRPLRLSRHLPNRPVDPSLPPDRRERSG